MLILSACPSPVPEGRLLGSVPCMGGLDLRPVAGWKGAAFHGHAPPLTPPIQAADLDVKAAEETAALAGPLAAAARCDVTSPASQEAAVADHVRRCGGLDIAVLNAGIAERGALLLGFPLPSVLADETPARGRRGGGGGWTPMPPGVRLSRVC